MKNIIKKGFILLFINLVVLIPASSQITLDSIEAKETALIFIEHEKLSNENPLLKQQISSLKELNYLYIKSDSIQKIEVNSLINRVESDKKIIQRYKSKQKKIIFGLSLSGIFLFIIGLIL